jgi:CheY-like chemotaxis protein
MIPSRIVSDPTRLKQILLNLVGNAVKFTEHGEIRIQVKYNNNSLYFAIKDTGLGMTPQQQQKVFQPFAQADDSMTRKFGGTGLGLVLSRQLSKQMGGDLILVESHKDRGSEFLVTISIGLPAQAHFISDFESSKTALALPSSHPDFLLKGLKILVVEDSPDNQILIQRFLTLAQAQVTLASNGSEGVATALANEFDIILMDVQMPIMDGLEATRMLRQKHYQKPILAVTAHALKEEGEACLQAGCNDHLAKPISRSALLSKVASLAHTVKVKS